jgi:hypothetical protein
VSISRLLTGHGEVHQLGWVEEVVAPMSPVVVADGCAGSRPTSVVRRGRRQVRGFDQLPVRPHAAYRYGHSQIRRSYRLQAGGPELPLFPDLLGFQPVPASRRVDWTQLFAFPGRPAPQPSKKIDGRLARSLIELPMAQSRHRHR